MRPFMEALRALRLLVYPTRTRKLYELGVLGDSFLDSDPALFIKRKHYLSRYFSVERRIGNVLVHYSYVKSHFDDAYLRRVYGEDGLVLWEDRLGDVRVRLRLETSGENRCEGDASVVLDINGRDTADMAYSFVDATSFGLQPGTTMFVTRSQIRPGSRDALGLFRHCYAHTSPQYFCLAAITGIALANDMSSIAAIRGKAQICYQPQFDASFRKSYCDFWEQFGARAADHQAYLLDVPLSLPPLASLPPKRRARAAKRRQYWTAITEGAESTIKAHRVQSATSAASNVYACALQGLAMALPDLVGLLQV